MILRVTFEVGQAGQLRIPAIAGHPLWTHNNELAHHETGEPLEIRLESLAEKAPLALRRERLPRIAAALGAAVQLPL